MTESAPDEAAETEADEPEHGWHPPHLPVLPLSWVLLAALVLVTLGGASMMRDRRRDRLAHGVLTVRAGIPAFTVLAGQDMQRSTTVAAPPDAVRGAPSSVKGRIAARALVAGRILTIRDLIPGTARPGATVVVLPVAALPAPPTGHRVWVILKGKDGRRGRVIVHKATAMGAAGRSLVIAVTPWRMRRLAKYLAAGRPLVTEASPTP